MMDQTDQDLMKAFQAGHNEAVEMMFQRYKLRVFHFCLGILGHRADAEEAAGATFLKLVQHKNTYHSDRTFSTWLYTLARNQCIDQIRKRRRVTFPWTVSRDGEERSWDVPDARDLSHEDLHKQEMAREVRAAISRLPLNQREALVLKQYHGLSYIQISEVLGCSLDSVKVLIFRSKERLRTELASFVKEERL